MDTVTYEIIFTSFKGMHWSKDIITFAIKSIKQNIIIFVISVSVELFCN